MNLIQIDEIGLELGDNRVKAFSTSPNNSGFRIVEDLAWSFDFSTFYENVDYKMSV